MVDHLLRPLNGMPRDGAVNHPGPDTQRPRPRRLGAIVAIAAVLGVGAANGASTPEVGMTTHRPTGAPGDVILRKPAAIGATTAAPTAATKTTGAVDPLRGLALDPTREAVVDSDADLAAAVRLRARDGSGDAEVAKQADASTAAGSTTAGSASAGSTGTEPTAPTDPTTSTSTSPVYVDAAGNARALPGGVIVTFRAPLDTDSARSALAATGYPVSRQLGPRSWLVETASGDAALDATRALAADPRFAAVEPNWWRQPAVK